MPSSPVLVGVRAAMYSDFLFPAWTGEGGKLRQQMRDEGGAAAVLLDQPAHPLEAQHLALRVVRLDQPVAVEQQGVPRL